MTKQQQPQQLKTPKKRNIATTFYYMYSSNINNLAEYNKRIISLK